jgi:hypothetical protein
MAMVMEILSENTNRLTGQGPETGPPADGDA